MKKNIAILLTWITITINHIFFCQSATLITRILYIAMFVSWAWLFIPKIRSDYHSHKHV